MHLTAQAPGIWEPALFPTPPVGQSAAWVEDNPASWPDNPGSRGASGSEGLHFAQDDGPAGSAVIDRCMDNVDNLAMSGNFPRLSLCARVFVICLTLVGLGLAAQRFVPGEDAVTVRSEGSNTADLVVASTAMPGAPEALLKMAIPVATPALPAPTPAPRDDPAWAQAIADTPLHLGPDARSPAVQFIPKGSPLRLLHAEGNDFQVYYGGDGHDHKASEGWVESASVVASPAPKWVQVRRGATLWADASTSRNGSGLLPDGAVLQVLGEQGMRLHIYYLGDGFSRDPAEGWVDAANLGPAGPLLVAAERGVRVLTKSDVQSLQSGAGVWLRVPYRSQFDGSPSEDANCGPASVGMALQYFHDSVPTAEVRAVADRLQGTSDPENGFAIEYLKGTVERFGLKGLDLLSGKDLRRWTLDDLRKSLSQDQPVIPQLRFREMPGRAGSDYGEDHYVVLTGMRGDDFIYSDSVDVDGPGYGRIMSAEDLKRAWGSSAFPFAAFAVAGP